MEVTLKDRAGNRQSFFVRFFNDLTKPDDMPQQVFIELSRYSQSLILVHWLGEVQLTTFFIVTGQKQVTWTGARYNSKGACGQQILFSNKASIIFRDAALVFLRVQNKKGLAIVMKEVYGLKGLFLSDKNSRETKKERNRELRKKQITLQLVTSGNADPLELMQFLNEQDKARQVKKQTTNSKKTKCVILNTQTDLFFSNDFNDDPLA